jgi:di/tricarboxylate transporter
LREGDVLLVRASPDQLLSIRQDAGMELRPVARYAPDTPGPVDADDDDAGQLVQAVVAPGSDLEGRTLREVDFRRRHGAIVVGLWRQGERPRRALGDIRLKGGDVLVLQGDDDALRSAGEDRAILTLMPFHGQARQRGKAVLAGVIMLATVVAAATGWLSIEIAALAGAAAMVLLRCLSGRQAYEAIDARIYVFIAGAIPLGAAMQKTGAADLLAGWLQGAVGGWPQLAVLLAMFAVVAVLTQFMSDAATTALFAPVAAAFALALGQPPEPYVVTVAMAAVASFLTPIGHHGNLLVYGPGRYQFADFVRVGAPLTVLVALVVCTLAPLLWRD